MINRSNTSVSSTHDANIELRELEAKNAELESQISTDNFKTKSEINIMREMLKQEIETTHKLKQTIIQVAQEIIF